MPPSVTILVVDDEPDVERLIRLALREEIRAGTYAVLFAEDGEAALDKLETHPEVEVVLTDLNMPRMDGLTLLDHLNPRPIRVVVVSAYGDLPNIRSAMKRGAFDFITKPIDRADLKQTLAKTVAEVSLDRETADVRRRLARAEQELEVASRVEAAKAQFFADVSHELRTPLTLLLGPLSDALHEENPAFDSALVRRMHRNAQRLYRLVNQFLDISEVDAGQLSLQVREQRLGPLLHETVSAFQSGADRKNIRLFLEDELGETGVFYDADKMEKIVANLLSNALKFTPTGGQVRVRAVQVDREVVVSVRDSGVGIAPEALERLFDRYYQAPSLAQPVARGTGIGLALVKAFTEAHHGTVHIQSEVGFGTTFTLRFPLGAEPFEPHELATEETGATAGREAAQSVVASDLERWDDDGAPAGSEQQVIDRMDASEGVRNQPTIVVIEDHVDVADYIASLLARRYRVVVAHDGDAGLEAVKRERPVLVCCDVRMPGSMDGHGVCRAIRALPEHGDVPIIMLTAQADAENRLEGLAAGVDAYMPKPFNSAELLLRVENLIDLRARLRDRYTQTATLGGSEVAVVSADAEWLERLKGTIEEQMHRPSFKIGHAAEAVGVSPRHLRRRLKELTGLAPSVYVRMLRMDRAAQLLAGKAGTVSEVAYKVGYLDAKYFSQQFRQIFGVNPSEYGG